MPRVLTLEQIEEAKALKDDGYTKRQLATLYGVGQTTIWDNVFYFKGKPVRRIVRSVRVVSPIVNSATIRFIVSIKKQEGYTSLDTANELDLPLKEVNLIYKSV